MTKMLLLMTLLSGAALADVEPGKTVIRGPISATVIFQQPIRLPVHGMMSPTQGVMIMIETTTEAATDFIVRVQMKGRATVEVNVNRTPKYPSPAWVQCDPSMVESIEITELRALTTQTF